MNSGSPGKNSANSASRGLDVRDFHGVRLSNCQKTLQKQAGICFLDFKAKITRQVQASAGSCAVNDPGSQSPCAAARMTEH
jgi:hypothetical protein